jgi:hypothetical protein
MTLELLGSVRRPEALEWRVRRPAFMIQSREMQDAAAVESNTADTGTLQKVAVAGRGAGMRAEDKICSRRGN